LPRWLASLQLQAPEAVEPESGRGDRHPMARVVEVVGSPVRGSAVVEYPRIRTEGVAPGHSLSVVQQEGVREVEASTPQDG